MAIDSLRDRGISCLRRMGGGYYLLRSAWRTMRRLVVECIRYLVPRRWFFGLPRGVFSLFEQLQAGQVEGSIYFTEQQIPVFGPDTLVKRSGLNQDGFQPWPVFRAQLHQARLFGRNLVLLNEHKQACRDFMFSAHSIASDESYRIPTLQKPVFLPGSWTSLVSRYDTGYWHFLMDVVPRLHALPCFPEDTGILIRAPIAEWQWEILRMLGVADRVRPTTETHLIVEELYYSSHTSMTGAYNPFAVQFLRENLMPQTAVDGGRRTEDGGQRPEDGGRRTEDGGRRTEDGGQRPEDGGQRPEDGGRRTEDGGRRTEDGGRRTEDGGRRTEVCSEKPSTQPASIATDNFRKERDTPCVDSQALGTRNQEPGTNVSINSATSPAKLYLKRSSDWTRGIRNQDAVCDFLKTRGWQIMEPERYSIKEQINLFARADAVCAAHGSALTNLLWMKPGAKVLELDADNFMLGAFEWLARAVGLEHRFLVFPGDHRLSFEVDLDQLGQAVEEMGGG